MQQDTIRSGIMRKVLTFTGGSFAAAQRELAEETSCRLFLNGTPQEDLRCSPWDIREAVTGRLWLSGKIEKAEDIQHLEIIGETVTVTTASASALQKPITGAPVAPQEILALSQQLEVRSRLFRRTGGVHSAAIARGSEILVYCEDISRHAAVDKAAGSCLLQKIPTVGAILVFSGRVPSEIVEKATVMGCHMIIARSAPTDHACLLAEARGITLIGFARDDTFNIYTCPERVLR